MAGKPTALLGRLWRTFWARAPRQLRFSREGKILVGIAFAAGLAAVNTGNNLLFLGWGMVLSAIVLSGVLSEATLKIVSLESGPPARARAGQAVHLPLTLSNDSPRLPALGLEVDVALEGPLGLATAPGPYHLRLNPLARQSSRVCFTPQHRGAHQVVGLRSRTSYPFGFFEKSRRFQPQRPVRFWVAPPAVDVGNLAVPLMARLGIEPAGRVGVGEDFFSLRPFRFGDDPRRIHWRRSAKADRLVTLETEAEAAREVMLSLRLDPRGPPEQVEHCIAVVGSLAERLLEHGLRVGISGPGTRVPSGSGDRQRWTILMALAKMDPAAPSRSAPVQRAVQVVVASPGLAVAGSEHVLVVPSRPERVA